MKLPAFLKVYTRKELHRLAYVAVAVIGLVGTLTQQIFSLQAQYEELVREVGAMPQIDATVDNRARITRAEGEALAKRTEKYEKIKKQVEGFIPQEGGKPPPLTVDQIVLSFPSSVDVNSSERFANAPHQFTERDYMPPGSTEVEVMSKPVYRYQSVAYAFTLRTGFSAFVTLFKQLDALHIYYFLRSLRLSVPPDIAAGSKEKDPKILVEMNIGSIYLLKDQPKPTVR
ncbi:MAG: hypothetical protein HY814_04890 [Candidatus Riflebacteria bacterium]|nr:hypothetical protein [Candidatus Riflebacteria bacterium]